MAKKKSILQYLGNGEYRVTGARVHPLTGLYIIPGAESSQTESAKSDSPSTKPVPKAYPSK